jgi:hypothetical protein
MPRNTWRGPEEGDSMNRRFLILAAVALSAISGGGGAAHGMVQGKSKPVRSTIDGKKVLPHRIHWYVKTHLASQRVRKVEFRVDGKLRWTEKNAPYSYGNDGNWLVTTWLHLGRHVFTARVITRSGKTFNDVVHARTLAPPPVPGGLAGTQWQRVVAGGKWTLSIDNTGWRISDPFGGKDYIDVVYPAAGTLEARNGIWTRNPTAAEQQTGEHTSKRETAGARTRTPPTRTTTPWVPARSHWCSSAASTAAHPPTERQGSGPGPGHRRGDLTRGAVCISDDPTSGGGRGSGGLRAHGRLSRSQPRGRGHRDR